MAPPANPLVVMLVIFAVTSVCAVVGIYGFSAAWQFLINAVSTFFSAIFAVLSSILFGFYSTLFGFSSDRKQPLPPSLHSSYIYTQAHADSAASPPPRMEKPKPFVMSMDSRKFGAIVHGNRIICAMAHKPDLQDLGWTKVWSTVRLEMRSHESQCVIYENVNISNVDQDKTALRSFTTLLVSSLRSFQESSDDLCNQVIYAPVFGNYCVNVEMNNAHLDVDYVFTYLDPKLLITFIVGAFLIYYAEMLSKCELFHYLSGISIGLVGSALVVLFIIMRTFPVKKLCAIVAFVGGGSAMFTKWLVENFKSATSSVKLYTLIYFAGTALASAIFCYYRGPVTDMRLLNIFKLFLMSVGAFLTYKSISYFHFWFALCGAIIIANTLRWACCWISTNYPNLAARCVPGFVARFFQSIVARLMENSAVRFVASYVPRFFIEGMQHRFVAPTRRLLTQEEFAREADEYTQQALKDLKDYCKSPECDKWKTISRLKSPDRLARFVQEDSDHLIESEKEEYERYSVSRDLMDEDMDDDE